jgi:hypothetical protein
LDAIAIIDGELVAFEIKSRFHGRLAGTLTLEGDLPKPRLGRVRRRADGSTSFAQASREYVLERVEQFIDVDEDTDVEVRLFVVDLKAFLAQEVTIEDGKIGQPLTRPMPCLDAAIEAAETIRAMANDE